MLRVNKKNIQVYMTKALGDTDTTPTRNEIVLMSTVKFENTQYNYSLLFFNLNMHLSAGLLLTLNIFLFNPLQANVPYLYSLGTFGFLTFQKYRNETMALYGLIG